MVDTSNLEKSFADLKKSFAGLYSIIATLQGMSHAGTATLCSGITEHSLKKAILTKMRRISRVLETRLFEGYGPISSFSAKIDIAYALDIITEAIFDDLKTIKDIRNEFAHPKDLEFLSFSSQEVFRHMKRLHSFDDSITDYEKFFVQKNVDIEKYLLVIIARSDIIRGHAEKNDAPLS
jgi:DNA-binding MltR family transcriptional regulator